MKPKYMLFLIPVAIIICLIFTSCPREIEVSIPLDKRTSSDTCVIEPTLKVFLENSGSMNAYMCAGSELKNSIYNYVTDVSKYTSAVDLYYINSDTIKVNTTIDNFIQGLNQSSFEYNFRKKGGNTKNTDLTQMLDLILSSVDSTTVCMFISDCLLDLASGESRESLTQWQIAIKGAVKKAREKIPGLAIEILYLESKFDGKYYYPDKVHGKKQKNEELTNVKRPFYIWFFGEVSVLKKLNKKVPLSTLEEHGLVNYVVFQSPVSVDYDIKAQKNDKKFITLGKNGYETKLYFNTENILDDRELINNEYYFFSDTTITDISVIKNKQEGYTHYVNFTLPDKVYKNTVVNLDIKNPIPTWVDDVNDTTGEDITSHLNQTTGIKNIIGGVSDAFNAPKEPLTTMTFVINGKKEQNEATISKDNSGEEKSSKK